MICTIQNNYNEKKNNWFRLIIIGTNLFIYMCGLFAFIAARMSLSIFAA